MLIEPLCPERPINLTIEETILSREIDIPTTSTSSTPMPTSSSPSSSSSSSVPHTSAQQTSEASSDSIRNTVMREIKLTERKTPCKSYTPISVCSRNVVSCFRGGDSDEGDGKEPAVQVPWIAHVLMGSGTDPDTYLDIKLIQ